MTHVVFEYQLDPIGEDLNLVVPVGTKVLDIRLTTLDNFSLAPQRRVLVVLVDPNEKRAELLRLYRVKPLQTVDTDNLSFLWADGAGSVWLDQRRHPLEVQEIT